MMVETYLRRGKRSLEQLAEKPGVRCAGAVLAYGGSGFLLSAASVGNASQPLAAGMICAATGWRTLAMSLGAMMGYPTFWGSAGIQGIVWSAAAGLLALLVGKKEESRDQPLMIPAIAAFLTATVGLCFRLILKDDTPLILSALRTALTFFSAALFTQAGRCRDALTEWLVCGVWVLALARVFVTEHFGLGYLAAGIISVGCAFPAAALAGLGLDLGQITAVPMTAVLCLAYFLSLIPFPKKWHRGLIPGIAWGAVAALCGIWDMAPLPGLAVGGFLGLLLPPRTAIARRRGETGGAQVQLEITAQALGSIRKLLQEQEDPPIDEMALLETVRDRACGGCSLRSACSQRDTLSPAMLRRPLEADCQKQGRLIPELRRANAHRKTLLADHRRRREYRRALSQQYGALSSYLQLLADRLPRSARRNPAQFRIEAGVRSRGKEGVNGDRSLAFPGPECCYYVLLCDGMGTGIGAARSGWEAEKLLHRLLSVGFPAEQALGTLNSLLLLRGSAGEVTVDLAQIHLDTGHAELYKWGAAPSWLLTRGKAEKIGTATPPPGISVEEKPLAVQKLSLRRGEVLILLSDGMDGERVHGLSDLSPDLPPGELAAKLLEMGGGNAEDDATAAVIRLRPTGLTTS
ncbi:MAG: SpoIIE family protein phosphatase [Oscillospiraceae bacterium]|nr:SpoIIE family protein phosphatase [Oscillospiraceae bacterium]